MSLPEVLTLTAGLWFSALVWGLGWYLTRPQAPAPDAVTIVAVPAPASEPFAILHTAPCVSRVTP